MNSKTNFTLSKYQRATLTEIGITSWQQIATAADVPEKDFSAKNDESNLSQNSGKHDFFQQSESVNTQTSKQAKSIPEHTLLLIKETPLGRAIINDILLTLNLPVNGLVTVSDGDAEDYADYLLAWKVAPEIALKGIILSTPDLSQLSSPEAKKHLWQILQNCHLFA
jgi:hypothetical protein